MEREGKADIQATEEQKEHTHFCNLIRGSSRQLTSSSKGPETCTSVHVYRALREITLLLSTKTTLATKLQYTSTSWLDVQDICEVRLETSWPKSSVSHLRIVRENICMVSCLFDLLLSRSLLIILMSVELSNAILTTFWLHVLIVLCITR